MEPPPSVATASGPSPAASAAPAPPEDPPAVRLTSHGFTVRPVSGLVVVKDQPNSGVVVLPTQMAPESRIRLAAGASARARASRKASDPLVVTMPRTSMRSFIE